MAGEKTGSLERRIVHNDGVNPTGNSTGKGEDV